MKTKFNGILTLLLAFVVQLTFAQEKTISGTVVDETNMPLPGATVVIKGTTTGAATDFDGKYTISANKGDVLSFSYAGYLNQEATIADSNTIDIALEPDSLEEVVITAIGIKRKPDEITTSNQVLKTEEITQAQNPDAIQSLAGKVSGLKITTTSTGLTPTTEILLRGTRSLTGNNEALIVIDGAISSASFLSDIDPTTIESYNVMKGANGAALYGSQGSNGVIIVTTKKGTNENAKFSVSVNSAVTFEKVAFLPETQTRYGQGYQGNLDVTDQGSWGPEYDGQLYPFGIDYPVGNYRFGVYSDNKDDNLKKFFNTGVLFQNSVNLAAGDKDGYINLSVNKRNTEGLIPNDTYHKEFFSVKAGKTAGRWTVDGAATYTTDKTDRVNGNMYDQLSQIAGNIDPTVYNSGKNEDHWTLYADSPYWMIQNQRTSVESNRFNGSATLLYQINDNISVKNLANINMFNGTTTFYRNRFIDDRQLDGDRSLQANYSTYDSTSRQIYNDILVNFDYMLTDDISFKANLGNNVQDYNFKRVGFAGNDVLFTDGFYNITNAIEDPSFTRFNNPSYGDTRLKERSYAVFGQIDLGYKDFLFLNATARNDWTSKLKKGNNSFFYPSVGLSFIPTKAFPSLKGKVLRKAKLSGSWVKVGNVSPVGIGASDDTVGQAPGFVLGGVNSFIANGTTFDPNLTPEFITSTEFNVNLEFLKGSRITLDASFYDSKNTDQILQVDASNASGASSAFINVGETNSKGFEIDLGFTPIKTDNVTWSNRLGYSTSKTTVKKVTDQSKSLLTRQPFGGVGIFAEEGEEFPLIKGTAYQRDELGRIKLDASGNPLTSSDFTKLGKTTPDYIINYSTSVTYKDLTLSAVLDYRTGHQFYSNIANSFTFTGQTVESAQNGREAFLFPNSVIETSAGSGVFVPNTNTLTGGSSAASFQSYYADNYRSFAENFVYDATALKLREVALSYNLPSKLLDNTFISNFTVGVSGRNLMMWLPKENRYGDPEIGNGMSTFSFTPSSRSYSFNVNIKF